MRPELTNSLALQPAMPSALTTKFCAHVPFLPPTIPRLPAGTYYGGRQVRDQVKQYLEQDTGIPRGPARRMEVRPRSAGDG